MGEEPIGVFLVDDHAMVREGLAALVAGQEDIAVVGQCGDGSEVVKEVTRLQPDVVLLDIVLPGLNGLEICRQLARRARKVGVLILTMHNDEEFIARALEYGARGYLLKDSAADRLAEAIRADARRQLYLGPGVPKKVLQRIGQVQADPYEQLTAREREVLQLIAEGMTNRRIAKQLRLSVKTVDTHRARLMRKLDIHDQTTLVKYAISKGMVR